MASRGGNLGTHFAIDHFKAGFSRASQTPFATVIASTDYDEAIESMKSFISEKKIEGFKLFLNGFLLATSSDEVTRENYFCKQEKYLYYYFLI
jgi:hypothetical protein